MAASVPGEPDMTLVAELLEDIQRHPPAVGAKTLLAEHYISIGWYDAASDYVEELKRDAPCDFDIVGLREVVQRQRALVQHTKPVKATGDSIKIGSSKESHHASIKRNTATRKMAATPRSNTPSNLADGYRDLRQRMKTFLDSAVHLQAHHRRLAMPQSGLSARIRAVVNGQDLSGVAFEKQPRSPQLVARAIQAHSDKAMEIVIVDLEDSLHILRARSSFPPINNDTLRESLLKRMLVLQTALPHPLKPPCSLALMHLEHERLHRSYANTETMLLDPISSIPRSNFYVTEDNYAWDLSELVAAISANEGVMRNPLSGQMFTPSDVRGIMGSAHGRSLVALQVAQKEMSEGVRPETIDRMEKLADVMLGERERDQMGSRRAMDEFQAYVATLPEREQKAVEAFRCPAVDGRTGRAYDGSVGQTVRDAKATELCIHKAGDFIKQAAAHLRDRRGGTAKAVEPEKGCVIM